MFLWKNFLVVAGALTFAWLLVRLVCDGRDERRQLDLLFLASLLMTFVAFTSLPVLPTVLAVPICLAFGASGRTPLLASYVVVTAVIPVLEVRIPGLFGLTTIVVLSVPLIAGLTVIVMRLVARAKFQQPGLRGSDLIMATFVAVLVILSTRGQTAQVVIRVLIETTFVLWGAYLVGSRARLPSTGFFLKALLFVGSALALVAMFEAVRRWPQYDALYGLKGAPLVRGMIVRVDFMRAIGPFADPLAYSIFLAITAIAGLGLVHIRKHRAVVAILVIIIVAGLAFTFSRTGLIALGTGLAVFATVRRKFSIYALVAVAGAVGALYVDYISGASTAGTSSYRMDVLRAGLQLIMDNPLFGANTAIEEGELKNLVQGQGIVDIVNSYIQLGIQGGFLLLLCFVALPGAALVGYFRFRAPRHAPARIFADVVLSQLAGLLAALTFTSLTDKNLVYVVLLSGLLLGTVSKRPRPRKRPDSTDSDPVEGLDDPPAGAALSVR